MKKISLSRFFVSIFMSACLTQTCLAQDSERMDKFVHAYADANAFSGSVLVVKGNDILLNKSYGSANIEWDIPNTPTTKFRLGSVTKQFTAASILLLEERGKLKLSDEIKTYLPDAPAAWSKITIFHLLTHTSGIPSFTGFPEFRSVARSSKEPHEIIDLFRDKPLEFQPGEKFNYSNSGYIVLGAIIEKISGESYEKFIQENIFTPLGMSNSGYDSNAAIIAHRAWGYTQRGHDIINADFADMSIPFSAGGLYSTTEDLLRWQRGLFEGKLLSAGSLKKMTTAFKDDYALGLFVSTTKGKQQFSHGGNIEGFNSSLTYRPDEKLSIIILSNREGIAATALSFKLAAIAGGEPSASFENTPIYLRGSMNAWGLRDKMQTVGHNIFEVKIALEKGMHEFKVGSEDFHAIDFGAVPGDGYTVPNSAKKMGASGENFFINVTQSTAYTFSIDTSNPDVPMITVKNVEKVVR